MSYLHRHTRTNVDKRQIKAILEASLVCVGWTVEEPSFARKGQHQLIFDLDSPFRHCETRLLI